MLYSIERRLVTDTDTDRQTDRQTRGYDHHRTSRASRGKNTAQSTYVPNSASPSVLVFQCSAETSTKYKLNRTEYRITTLSGYAVQYLISGPRPTLERRRAVSFCTHGRAPELDKNCSHGSKMATDENKVTVCALVT